MSPSNEHSETSLSTAQKAKKLLEANFINVGKKVLAGQTLSSAEVALLKERAAEKGDDDTQGFVPKFAKTKKELADILKKSRKTITRYSAREDAPKPRSDGRLSVEEWRRFLAAHGALDESEDLDHGALKARQILLQNSLLEHKLSVARGEFVAVVDVERDTASLIGVAKAVLLAGPSSLAPQVVGVSVPEAEALLRQWLHEALSKLCLNPFGTAEEREAAHA
jgi:hypothetical protein